MLALRDGEAVEDLSLCLQLLVSQLVVLAVAITDEKAVAKYLPVVPPKYTQITLSMEMLIDLSTLTLEDVIGHLRAVDECVEMAMTVAGGKLLMTEEWTARMREKWSGEGSSSRGGDGKRCGKAPQKKKKDGVPLHMDTCRRCGKTGHWA